MRGRLVAILVVALLLPACGGPRSGASVVNALGGCAAAIPAARVAVHGRGTLVVVQRLRQTQADQVAREVARLAAAHARPTGSATAGAHPAPAASTDPAAGPRPTPLPSRGAASPRDCLIVWRGPYRAGEVTPSEGRLSGTFALVFVTARHPRVRLLVLTEHLPRAVRP